MKIVKILLPLLILAAAVAIALYFARTGPEPVRKPTAVVIPNVDAMTLKQGDYQVRVRSQGSIEPRTQTTLVAEVSGQIVEVSAQFREGSFFKQGDILLRIDPRDYVNAVTIAEAELAQAQVTLNQEQAQADLAQRDWQRLGSGGEPGELVLRKPQLASARAALAAAQARLKQAQTNLARTSIRAPYSGRVLEQVADLGQFVTPGTRLGSIFASDSLEVRLPITSAQLQFLDLPVHFADETIDPKSLPKARLSNGRDSWEGQVIRSAGALDAKTRQQFVIVQVKEPYIRQQGQSSPLRIGEFVKVEIAGRSLSGVFTLPSAAVTDGNQVLLVDSENKLKRLQIEVLWSTPEEVVTSTEIAEDMRLSLTAIPLAVDGMKVKVKGDDPVSPSDSTAPGTSAAAEAKR